MASSNVIETDAFEAIGITIIVDSLIGISTESFNRKFFVINKVMSLLLIQGHRKKLTFYVIYS